MNPVIRVPQNAPLGVRLASGAMMFVAWRLATAAAVAMFIGVIWYAISPFVAILAGLVIFVGLPALAAAMTQIRERRARVILTYLEQATRLNLPLPRMLEAAQRSEQKGTARRLRRLGDLLEDGAPLEAALPVATPEFSARMVGLIGAGERLGNLQQVLGRLVAQPREEEDDAAVRSSYARWYPLLMSVAFSLLLMLVIFFVVPKLVDLSKDFGVKLPYATRTLMHIGRGLRDLDFAPMLIVVVVLVTVMGSPVRQIFDDGPSVGMGGFDQILWRLPIAHGLARDRGFGDIFNTMAVALRAGYSLPRAIEEAEGLRLNAVLRKRLRRWRNGIEGGAAADQAGRAARLPALVCGMIGSGKGGDLAAAMEFLASYYDGRFSRGREILRAAIVPVLAIGFGGVVLFMASGTYLPLLQMMDRLSETALKVSK